MINPSQSLDDFLVRRANSAVKIWNKVTGRSRSELSTLLIAAGCSVIAADSFMYPKYAIKPYVTVPEMCFVTAGLAKLDYELEKEEIKESENNIKDSNVELFKSIGKNFGVFIGGLAGMMIAKSINEKNPEISRSGFLSSIGFGLIATGLYITAADSVPTKNYISKAYNKLSEYVRGYWKR